MTDARKPPAREPGRPEILAPAGGPSSWAAALAAGADAVYAGLDHFSARAYAENFSLAELNGLVEESRRVGVKVYLAFNSLIKDTELAEAFKTLCAVSEMRPDALIVQDLGLAHLVRKYHPGLPLHASTLTAVHNVDGLAALASLGFSRAVLPRELNLSEISVLSQRSPIGVEVFVHGALCFSFSGLCLMSSFLGGRSALRGGCTQPCRRAYQNAGRQRTFFSLSDFLGLGFIPELRKLPIAALKIEGRMKGPDYVGQVVKAYRLMLDADENSLEEAYGQASELLKAIPGRPSGPGFIAGDPMAPAIWEGRNSSGLKLGELRPAGKGLGQITLVAPLRLLDRLRLVGDVGEDGQAHKLRRMWRDGQEVSEAARGETVTIAIGDPGQAPPAGLVLRIGSGSLEKELMASEPVKRLRSLARQYSPPSPGPAPALGRERGQTPMAPGRSQPLWLWLDGPHNLQDMLRLRPRKIILPLTAENAKELGRQRKMLSSFSDFVWSLPPLLLGHGQEKARREAAKLIEAGHRDFMISNLGQAPFMSRLKPGGLKIWADHRLGVLNHLAGQALHELGLAGVTISLESDQETIARLAQASFPGGVLMYLYGRPALFTSRFRPPSLRRGPIVSQRGEKFWAAEDGDAFILQSEHRVFLGGLLKAPKPRGFVGLVIDLRREPNPAEAARRLRKAIDQGRGSPGLSFNFKRGLH
ncbi:MAG: U32 family peptidase [Deltaproteobacteria bacterium]|nr:U32 family peptidase [Deltaproteobacteria bacterium]